MRAVTLDEMQAYGERLGRELQPGVVLLFDGELGAGKTTLITAIARGLGVPTGATSPTYGLVHRYQGRRGPVFHLDCYRLRTTEDAADLGWDRLLTEADALLVEWPDRAGSWLPQGGRRFHLSHLTEPDLRGIEER
ncbi:MAG: tRNA (adenosine(37)-N6)-threonylcarbamoyltransferase complex ATPase subunit type 1 TsaE [Gemmatimonadota bacterium]